MSHIAALDVVELELSTPWQSSNRILLRSMPTTHSDGRDCVYLTTRPSTHFWAQADIHHCFRVSLTKVRG